MDKLDNIQRKLTARRKWAPSVEDLRNVNAESEQIQLA